MLKLPTNVVESIRRQLNMPDLKSKMTFTEFLSLLQKEAFFREALSEAQIYKMSAQRLNYEQEMTLVTAQQLEILKQMKKQCGFRMEEKNFKVPNFSYLIDHLIMFEFQSVLYLMVAFENKSVQILDYNTGLSVYEFNFNDRAHQSQIQSERQAEALSQQRTNLSQKKESQNVRTSSNFLKVPSQQLRQLSRRSQQIKVQNESGLLATQESIRVEDEINSFSTKKQSSFSFRSKRVTVNSEAQILRKATNSLSQQRLDHLNTSQNFSRTRDQIIQPNSRPHQILGISSLFEENNETLNCNKMNEHQNDGSKSERGKNHFQELKRFFSQQPKQATKQKYASLLNDSSAIKLQEETLHNCQERRRNAINSLAQLKEKERKKATALDQIILLNKATETMQVMTKLGIQDYDLIHELEEGEAETANGIVGGPHEPLYRQLYPEWGRLQAKQFLGSVERCVSQEKKQEKQKKGQKTPSTSYPMCMTYYNKLNLCVFALVSEIAIYQVSQGGTNKIFAHVASHRIDSNNEFIPTCLEVAQHKVTNKLLVCLAVQSSRLNKITNEYDSYVIVYEFDQLNKFCVQEIFKRKSPVSQITKILYRAECGLIVACFQGYIELLDSIEFQYKFKWDNQLNNLTETEKTEIPQKSNQLIKDQTNKSIKELKLNQTDEQLEFNSVDIKIRPSTTKQANKTRIIKPRLLSQNNKKDEKKVKKSVMTIDCLDYSAALDLIAFGGVQGKIGVLDSATLTFKGMYDAHTCEITGIYFYDNQYQMLSMGLNGEVTLWDAQKMTNLQTVRNKQYMQVSQVSSSFFSKELGTLLLATSKVFRWQLVEDSATNIMIEQQHAVARDFLSQFRQTLVQSGVIKNTVDHSKLSVNPLKQLHSENINLKQGENIVSHRITHKNEQQHIFQSASRNIQNSHHSQTNLRVQISEKGNISKLLANEDQVYIQKIFDEKNLKSTCQIRKKTGKQINYSVLPSRNTELAGCFFHSQTNYVFTVDIHCLVRMWCLKSGNCVRSYPLESLSDSLKSSDTSETAIAFKQKYKIQYCSLDPSLKLLLVAFQGGVIQLHNIFNGTIQFNKSAEETLNIVQEVANVCWFGDQSSFWFVATCWEGQVAFFSHPHSLKGREYITCKKVLSFHNRDVTCVDVTTKNYLVTGSLDNLICFWNTFNCQINKQIQIPKQLAPTIQGNNICSLNYADQSSNELLLVFMNEGEVLCLDIVNETFIQQKDGGFSLAIIKKFSVIDIKDGYCLSVSEKGQGCLHRVILSKKSSLSTSSSLIIQNVSSSKIAVAMNLSYEFSCSQKVSIPFNKNELQLLSSKQTITSVKVEPSKDFFLVCQLDGVIHFKSLNTFSHLCYLNDPNSNFELINSIVNKMTEHKEDEAIIKKTKSHQKTVNV